MLNQTYMQQAQGRLFFSFVTVAIILLNLDDVEIFRYIKVEVSAILIQLQQFMTRLDFSLLHCLYLQPHLF